MSNLVKLLKNGASIEEIKVDLLDNQSNKDYINIMIDGVTALMTGCWCGREDVVQLLLEKGANANIQEDCSALMMTFKSSINILKILLNSGANINYQNKYGETALFEASKFQHWDKVQYLIEAGADVNLKNKSGSSPILHASINGCVEIVNSLINAGADVNIKDDNGITPLMRASNFEIIKMLIEAGANINAQDKNGETPLKNALDNKDFKSIKFLLERGADVNSHWNFGESFRHNPLYSAVNIGNIEAVKLLLDYGADRDMVVKDGREKSLRTPLMIAQEKNHTDVAELLQNYKGNNVVTFHGVKFQRVID